MKMRLAICFVLAIVITFITSAVASLWPADVEPFGLIRSDTSNETWEVAKSTSPTVVQVNYWHLQISGMSLSLPTKDFEARRVDITPLPAHLRPTSIDDLTIWASFIDAGFPFRAMYGEIQWKTQQGGDITYVARGGVLIPSQRGSDPRMLPMRPVWPAFAANVAVYTVLAMLSFRLFVSLRAGHRRRRSKCPHCCYSTLGLGVGASCPECGKPLSNETPRDASPASKQA